MFYARAGPNIYLFNATMGACEKSSRWQGALHLFERLPNTKLRPDAVSYNLTMSALQKGTQWQKALQLFASMRVEGVEPSGVTYNISLSACEKGSQWQQALALFQAMGKNGLRPDIITCNTLLLRRIDRIFFGFPLSYCPQKAKLLGVAFPFFPGILLSRKLPWKPRKNGSCFWKERWLKRMEPVSHNQNLSK